MAPSPALRWSSGWEHGAENNHKRGHSLESGLTLKTKDDDLLLFNEMQNHERDNFLLHTADDFDESLSKLRHFSNFKLGITIPTGGESSDLLNMGGDKNDYDWLLTPPDTPLFSSLDDDYPQPINFVPRNRARSQPVMTSRSVVKKSYRASRTSSSPHRLSSSSRSISALAQMRGRPTLAPRSSPPRVVRSATPNRRSSTSPNKQSAQTHSSSTPTLQKVSIGSSIHSSNNGGRGPSPVNPRHGKSASPKLGGWQMTLPSFTSEAPPNLRTSLSDRPISLARGPSQASRNGSESSEKLGRKSMSPTSSRSISSSHSRERDCFSSYSKCSLASSSDDYEESLRSITVGISKGPLPRKDGASGSNKAISFSRKLSRSPPTNCVPKRSFNSALRLMDQHKTPQNMFRPLLSSVPATTFRPIFSRNSSLTTSSNASSDQGVISVAHDVDGSELESTELSVGWERTEDSETHEGVFLFDKVDEIIADSSHEVLSRKPQGHSGNSDENFRKKFDAEDIQNPIVHIDAETSHATFESAHVTDKSCDFGDHTTMEVCSKCGKNFKILDVAVNIILCQGCVEEYWLCTKGINLANLPLTKIVASQMDNAVDTFGKGPLNSEMPEYCGSNVNVLHQHERNIVLRSNSLPNVGSMQLLNQGESVLSGHHSDIKRTMNTSENCSISAPHLSNHAVNSSLKVDIPECTGISVLLMQRTGSGKWPILQGKTVSTANIICSEPSYLRDNISASRSNIGQDGPSAASSVDLGSSRQMETSIPHQLCWEGEASNIDSSVQNMGLPDPSINCYESRCLKSECEEASRCYSKCLENNSFTEIILVTEEQVNNSDKKYFSAVSSSSSSSVVSENYISEHTETYRTTEGLEGQQFFDHQGNDDLPCSSAVGGLCNEDWTSSVLTDKCMQSESNAQNLERKTDISSCLGDVRFQTDNSDDATKSSSIPNLALQHGFVELVECQNESLLSHCSGFSEQSNGHSLFGAPASDISFSISEPITAVQAHGNYEESCMTLELMREHMSRNLTLEEATDRLLFCNSIIHEVAYKAVTDGVEKLNSPQAPSPALTFLDKPIPGLRDSSKMPSKHTPRSQMFRRKRIDSRTKSPAKELENDVEVVEFTAPTVEITGKIDPAKPQRMESKCNCCVM